jgi:hypothetical protein
MSYGRKVEGYAESASAAGRAESSREHIAPIAMPDDNLFETIFLLSRTPATLYALLRDLPDSWTRRNEGDATWTAIAVLRRQAKVGSSLKHVELRCLARDYGNQLDPGRAGTDYPYPDSVRSVRACGRSDGADGAGAASRLAAYLKTLCRCWSDLPRRGGSPKRMHRELAHASGTLMVALAPAGRHVI